MEIDSDSVQRVVGDFANADLGDPRRTCRVQMVASRLAQAPDAPLPVAMVSAAELEGAYRIVNNGHVTFDKLLSAHSAAVQERAEAAKEVLVVHDTTPCAFPHLDPSEIGYLTTGQAGFPLHLSLVIDGTGWRRPLGVIQAEALFRSGPSKDGKEPREFDRWLRGIKASAKALGGCERVVHVADCETDSYELMANVLAGGHDFVFRVRVGSRRSRDASSDDACWSTVTEVARGCEGVLERDVPLTRRKEHTVANKKKAHPPRKSRLARLQFAATRVVIPRPHRVEKSYPEMLELNLVHVREIEPEPGQPAVEWLLYTTKPIDTGEQVAVVVDTYRSRWTIEEFNAALKTGCAYEARQFESRHALMNMLALSLPVACEILGLRSCARSNPDGPATNVLRETQLDVLRQFGDYKWPANPTARDALLAVARFGGHVKANGEPGWKVLFRGMTRLCEYEKVWVAAREGRPAPDL